MSKCQSVNSKWTTKEENNQGLFPWRGSSKVQLISQPATSVLQTYKKMKQSSKSQACCQLGPLLPILLGNGTVYSLYSIITQTNKYWAIWQRVWETYSVIRLICGAVERFAEWKADCYGLTFVSDVGQLISCQFIEKVLANYHTR